jgi:hypothetical protein
MEAIRVTRDETDVVGVSEEELEDFLASRDVSVGEIKKVSKKKMPSRFVPRHSHHQDVDLGERKKSNPRNEDKIKNAITSVLKKEGGAAGLKPILAIAKKLGATKSQIKKILNSMGKVEKHTNGDYILTPINNEIKYSADQRAIMKYHKGFRKGQLKNEYGCTEQEIAEGNCGYNEKTNGDKLSTPGGTRGMDANTRTTLISLKEKIKNTIDKINKK